jgi:hypothetical protein
MAEGDTFAVAALARKRAEMAAELGTLERRAGQVRADLCHLDAVMRLLDPGAKPDAIPAKPPRTPGLFADGELPRAVLDVLRPAREPLTVCEVATAVMEARGLDPADEATFRTVGKAIENVLRRRRDGPVERIALGGQAVAWRVRR